MVILIFYNFEGRNVKFSPLYYLLLLLKSTEDLISPILLIMFVCLGGMRCITVESELKLDYFTRCSLKVRLQR